ncbi:unnamed protein product [Rhizophagus irregularis]|uniref:Uncharacterized protein n=1 Tax=Rhizophagus irregularis TaxID=588596 RepID=A0A915ZXB4_9GLOM|nr:unnamed protein product [Rhizophagus irregularis]
MILKDLDDNYANEDEDVDAGEDEDDNDADKDEDGAADEDDDNADEDEDGAADEYEYYDADEDEDGAADEHEYYDENEVKNGDNIDDNGGNIPNWRRNFPDAKVLIGFLQHLTTRNNKLRESKEFRQMQRKLEQCALKILLELLLQNDSIYLAINGTVEHFTPYLSTILADMLEAQNICCTYKSYRAKYPCYKCLTPGD